MKEYYEGKKNLQGKTVDKETFQKVLNFYKDVDYLEIIDVYKIPEHIMKDLELYHSHRVIVYNKRTKLTLDYGADNIIEKGGMNEKPADTTIV